MKKRILPFMLVLGLLTGPCACGNGGLPPAPVSSVAEIDGTVFILYGGAIYRESGESWSPIADGAEEMTAWDGRIYYLSQGGKHCTLIQPDGTVDYESEITYALRNPQAIRRNEAKNIWVSCISLGEKGILRLYEPGSSEAVLGIAPRTRSYCKAGLWFYYATKTALFAAREDGNYIGCEIARGKDISNLQANGDGSVLYYSDEGLLYSIEATGLVGDSVDILPFPAPQRLSADTSARWVVDGGYAYYVSGGALCSLELISLKKTVLVKSGCTEAVGAIGSGVYYAVEQGFRRITPDGGEPQQLIP